MSIGGVVTTVALLVMVAYLFWQGAFENPDAQRRSCLSAGGHYVLQLVSVNECWSPDGTRRLFPEGF